jgi:hypothetical protein
MLRIAVALCLAAVLGCDRPSPTNSGGGTTSPSEPAPKHDHSHERGKMLIADAGPYHALLTAHLSKDGHELDLFFETTGKSPKPVALPVAALTATIQVRKGEGELKRVEFRPAPPDERPAGEGPDRCSHFVAKTPWLDPDVPLRVTIELTIEGDAEKIQWNDFVPRKYAHHQD